MAIPDTGPNRLKALIFRLHVCGLVAQPSTGTAKKRALCRRHLFAVAGRRRPVAVSVERHLDGAVAHSCLHCLRCQLEAAVNFPAEQPVGVPIPQRMEAGVFRRQYRIAFLIDLLGSDRDAGGL